MSERLQNQFSIEIQQKLYEKNTPRGNLAVYESNPFGMLLTLDDRILISEADGFFTDEMLTHPALFTHPHPHKIAILGNGLGALVEVLKHTSVKEVHCIVNDEHVDEAIAQYFAPLNHAKNDVRVRYHFADPIQWLTSHQSLGFDVIIQHGNDANFSHQHYEHFLQALNPNGILVQSCQSSLLQLKNLKPIFQSVRAAGFHDTHFLNFPQPSSPTGWRIVMMATKAATFNQLREKDVYNRPFKTRYYNFDTHKAAFALPEFIRQELEVESQ